ncbi:MAG: transposase [Ferrovum myxofaciens]
MSLTSSVCLLLSEWISFLLAAVPPRSRRTFVELLIGCMLNPEGWVTRAIGAIRREAHWTTYYKLIERANVSVADLSIQLLQLTQRVFPNELVNLIIDDTLVPRCAKKGPGISVKHDHSHKANRPTFLNSQGWVTLALVVRVRLGSALTIPIRSWLVEESGQRGKLWVARQLIESVRGNVREARLLIDAWFMRKSLILPLLEQRVRIIGQVRRDTALYLPPEPEPKRRGPKRKYGQRLDAAMLDTLPAQEMNLMLYGKLQLVRLRSAITVARFLKGARAGGVVRDASGRQHLVASAPDSGHRDGIVGSGRGGNLRRTLGYRAFVPQPEAMVGGDEPVATIEGGSGTVDADSFHSLCLDPIARPETVGILSVDGNRALAQGSNDHGGTFRSVDAHPIYRTSRTPCLQPEVGEFRDAFPHSGSTIAVLRHATPCPSLSNRPVFVFSPPHHHGKSWVAGRGECLKFSND